MKKFILPTALALYSVLQASASSFGDTASKTGFVGYLYDLKADEKGEPTDVVESGSSLTGFYDAFGSLIRKKFSDKALSKYASADEANSLKYFIVPHTKAEEAPAEFGSPYIKPNQIIMVYKGVIEEAPKEEFRFAGVFDDAMCVLVNGKLVFYVSRHEDELRYKPDEVSNRRKKDGVSYVGYGEYLELEKGDEVTLVAAEVPGGGMSGKLLVQLKDYEYKKDSHEDPILHPFVCAELDAEDESVLKSSGVTMTGIPQFKFKVE
ncbi:hypothetical protein ACFPK9_04215 [Rubritalea spongiae]|uniref:PA14 domain-containing protein n=1 Tax=Rubritalea spongiae TaxID=430797 RepID=A0ABW5E5T7_9BACT